MPIKEFICRHCGNEWTKILYRSEPYTAKCEECGGQGDVKVSLVASRAYRFQGEGNNKTDGRRKT